MIHIIPCMCNLYTGPCSKIGNHDNPPFQLELNEWNTCKAKPDWLVKGKKKGVCMPISVIWMQSACLGVHSRGLSISSRHSQMLIAGGGGSRRCWCVHQGFVANDVNPAQQEVCVSHGWSLSVWAAALYACRVLTATLAQMFTKDLGASKLDFELFIVSSAEQPQLQFRGRKVSRSGFAFFD